MADYFTREQIPDDLLNYFEEVTPEPIQSVVFDPFAGVGTTCLVAWRLGRRYIGIELSPEYATMGRQRVIGDAPLLALMEGG